jgi:hypothetical protein
MGEPQEQGKNRPLIHRPSFEGPDRLGIFKVSWIVILTAATAVSYIIGHMEQWDLALKT